MSHIKLISQQIRNVVYQHFLNVDISNLYNPSETRCHTFDENGEFEEEHYMLCHIYWDAIADKNKVFVIWKIWKETEKMCMINKLGAYFNNIYIEIGNSL